MVAPKLKARVFCLSYAFVFLKNLARSLPRPTPSPPRPLGRQAWEQRLPAYVLEPSPWPQPYGRRGTFPGWMAVAGPELKDSLERDWRKNVDWT